MSLRQFAVYILYSALKDKFYIGHTGDDLNSRLKKHNSNHSGFTGKTSDWKIVFTEHCATKEKALQREFEIKRWKSKKMILNLISTASEHPD